MTVKLYIWTVARLNALLEEERAATLVEYALMIAIAILTAVIGAKVFSDSFREMTNFIGNRVGTAVSGGT